MKKFSEEQLVEIQSTFAAVVLTTKSYALALSSLQKNPKTYAAVKNMLFSKDYYELRLEEARIKTILVKLALDPSQFSQLNATRARANEVEIKIRTLTSKEVPKIKEVLSAYLSNE